jgi:2-oxoglutarate dehydrogenase E2 component (dihydrolipoamide succinyltransferase)
MADLVVPALGESITEAVIGRWLIEVGQHVYADQPVVDLETDKITVQLPAPATGALKEQRFGEGDTVRVGDIVGLIDTEAAGRAAAAPPAKAPAAPPSDSAPSVAAPAPSEPASAEIPERDGRGRILSPSQRRAIRSGETPAPRQAETDERPQRRVEARQPALPSAEREQVVPMSPLRRRIAERLVQAQQSSASLTTFNEVDMSAIIALRKEYKEDFLATHGVKLGFMSFAVKAAVEALRLFPGLNAEVRGESIVYKKYYDLGIAVGTEKGLVVPVLRQCESLGFAEVEQGIIDLATRARNNRLQLEDLVGGTFSITNGGIYGSMMSTPLLNFPQTGILGLHNIVERPMAVSGQVEVRPVMYLALTYDHRVVDGKEAVQFLVAVKERMENPQRLLFGV